MPGQQSYDEVDEEFLSRVSEKQKAPLVYVGRISPCLTAEMILKAAAAEQAIELFYIRSAKTRAPLIVIRLPDKKLYAIGGIPDAPVKLSPVMVGS